MAKVTETKKRRLIKTSDKKIEKNPKTKKLKPKQQEEKEEEELLEEQQQNPNQKQAQSEESASDSDSDSDSSDVENLPQLLEAYSKDQLIQLITEAASKDSALFNRIRDAADGDVSHRKIFVHGLGWDTTRETLVAAFEPFGEIEDCNVVLDKLTGKAKGYGFVLFKTRRGAAKALKDPKKSISNRIASCQLASVGPATNNNPTTTSSSSFNAQSDAASRKIYVSSVPHDADGEKLRNLFAKFGEIETGPIGFDSQTGKSRGFALFVYKTVEGAKKALEEPYKVFEGHQLQCQRAAEGSKSKNSAIPPPQTQTQVQPAPLVPQNMALFGQHQTLNPMYGGLMGNVSGGMVPGSANPAMMARGLNSGVMGGALNPSVIPVSQVGHMGAGFGGYSLGAGSHGLVGLGGGAHGLLGAYGTSGALPTLQGLQHVYPNPQVQHPASARPQGAGGSLNGYPSYMWYE